MREIVNWLWLVAGSAAVVIGTGLIAKAYWLLFMFGWGFI